MRRKVHFFLAVKCGRLRQPAFGAIYPESCGQRKMPYRQRCAFACQPGFRLQGPSLRECILPGSWTGGTQSTRCIGKSFEYTKLHPSLLLFQWLKNQATFSKDPRHSHGCQRVESNDYLSQYLLVLCGA